MNRCGGVSCCFLFEPGPFFDGFVGDFLFTFLQLLKEEAAPAAAVCRNVFPALGDIIILTEKSDIQTNDRKD